MATVGQIYYNVLDTNSGSYISSGQDIFSDVVTAYGASQFHKLGIQAPPGTKVIMNTTKNIMIGRTGIYELDDDISIVSLYFVRPYKYIKDEEQTQEYIDEGTEAMMQAHAIREEQMQALEEEYPIIPSQETDPAGYKAYWDKYNQIQSTYIQAYEAGLTKYHDGMNGIYVLPNPNDPTAEENYQDLFNIIVDFIYE